MAGDVGEYPAAARAAWDPAGKSGLKLPDWHTAPARLYAGVPLPLLLV